ncbi:MAG TPA: fumarylacetoacetate hydrolase family protein [Alphaproteobacteria bacterium]|nr:fumarylacetoacetate hydrolase family protein [Alphaproteobacteria bacterium]
MKLASLKDGRDGRLVLVSHDLMRATAVPEIAPTLQAALDDWARVEPLLRERALALEAGRVLRPFPFEPARCAAPLPRAYQWADGSAYVVHVQLVRKARGAEMPESFWHDPLMYQGGSANFLGPDEPIRIADESWGVDFESEIAVVTDDVPMGIGAEQAGPHIKLLMLVNDVSLRNLIPTELAKGFGFFQSKTWTGFSPVAATPDELGESWDGGSIDLPLVTRLNGAIFGHPNARAGMVFDFRKLVHHAARTRPLVAGTIIGSGTVANEDRDVGSSCIAERRAIETIEHGAPKTPFMKFGDHVRIEMFDHRARSIFGAIDQTLQRYHVP